MKTDILLFAGLRERFHTDRISMTLPEGTCAREVLDLLCQDKQEGTKLARCTLFAVNQCYVPPETVLKDGDELVLIPPVAGG